MVSKQHNKPHKNQLTKGPTSSTDVLKQTLLDVSTKSTADLEVLLDTHNDKLPDQDKMKFLRLRNSMNKLATNLYLSIDQKGPYTIN